MGENQPMTDPNLPIEKISAALNDLDGATPNDLTVYPLAGDASDRRYYRAQYTSDGAARRFVVMDILDVQNICKSEEVTLYHDDSGELPFINIHRFLDQIGAPVPRIHYFDRKSGLMLLEDMGDRLLLDEVRDASTQRRRELYTLAVQTLVQLIAGAQPKRQGSDCVAFSQRFAPDLLAWEFDHYIEYGIEQNFGVQIQPGERAFLRDQFRAISERIAALPTVFTHRDYHSRNLMFHQDRLVLIDFQDALSGPLPYDLASLLRDSYIDIGDPLRDEMIALFVEQYGAATGQPLDPVEFRNDFDLVAMQRNLKAAGRFVFIDKVKHNSAYLESIPRTLSYVAGDGRRNPDLAPVFEILVRYEPRLGGQS